MNKFTPLIAVSMLLLSCSRMESVERSEAMRASPGPESSLLSDSLEQWRQRNEHLALNIKWLEKNPQKELIFGPCHISAGAYAKALKPLLKLKGKNFMRGLKENFQFYEVYGKDQWGEILLTSYYSPVIKGSRKPTSKFSQALYRMPDDLVLISLKDFISDHIVDEDSYSRGLLPAKLEYDKAGKISKISPYYSRQEIDGDLALKGKGLELVYVDPIDAFFLQIQGSGLVELEDGSRLSLGYAGQNGHRYYSIGKSLFDIIPQEQMSKDKLVTYLKSLDPQKRRDLLFENPSYVFFKELNQKEGVTTFGPSVIDKRTLAIDYRVFPLGGMAFIDFSSPSIKTQKELQDFTSDQLVREGRFVFAHDSGGAIKGPGRADLYWGTGDIASYNAGVMRHRGKMWFLAPRDCREI